LIVASHFTNVVGVYNLEGCVHRGFLAKLKTVDWNQPVTIPAAALKKADTMRSRIHAALWLGTNLPYFTLIFLGVIVWWILRRKHKKRLASIGRF
jgi:cbb3-type cytochrome oxidase subunit 3